MKTIAENSKKWIIALLGFTLLGFSKDADSLKVAIDKPEMVRIQGGTFTMGQKDGEQDEKPEHLVEIRDFYLAKFEVTVSQYRAFCVATGRDMPKEPGWGWIDTHPIINTSWNDASSYIEWLNARTDEKYRLPTEAEFEYALRNGGEKGNYPWGNGKPEGENLADESLRKETSRSNIWAGYDDGYAFTAPVGSFKPNKLGLYDLNGNIWEWCSDWYASYPNQKTVNPQGAVSGKAKVGRGGSYDADPWHSRSASRAFVEPTFKRPGFRLARDIEI
ncbi:formylglycine-generating enzyme family protein [Robiginitalea sp. IMCC43444]|uniref:formylglycine-generating enzyme family protein n=1 Tax=Robiginitalea sp. IMCC43444 TaxID=3459121 RepID=UPI0040427915